MVRKKETWYKEGWSLDIKNQSWTEDTKRQIDFLIKTLELTGTEKVLDLACGFGRHSLELARRGFTVVGIDITKEYVEDATKQAAAENLSAKFVHMDIRDVNFKEEFDVVLNMADGAIGYLENDAENLKIFDVIAKSLRPGGKHIMDIMSADYADTHFPCNLWDMGQNGITLSKFEWNQESKIMLYGQNDFAYGDVLTIPKFESGDPIRLYHRKEIEQIMKKRDMQVKQVFGNFNEMAKNDTEIQMIVCSEKTLSAHI
ncbi:MAG: class I SAM-dependent methyltransferase [Lachnospiraceae bacterium]|nr:class I SAM-dependent methyltransferase [Lachnospiraceae bacterium]